MKNELKKQLGEKIVEFARKEEPSLSAKQLRASVSAAWKLLTKEVKG